MARIIYLNGSFIPEDQAKISLFDRATLFADAIYEVCVFLQQQFLDFDAHMARLQNSLQKLDIDYPVDSKALLDMHRQLMQNNNLQDGVVYMQISRGVAERNFRYDTPMTPTIFAFTQPHVMPTQIQLEKGLKLTFKPDKRWANRDIKTTQLVYASMARTQAIKEGFDDVALVDDDMMVTEASAANLHIIDDQKRLITRPLDGTILPGVTRARLLHLAKNIGIEVVERKFSTDEVSAAEEVFISSAGHFAMPVTQINDTKIGTGKAGKLTLKLRQLYLQNTPRHT